MTDVERHPSADLDDITHQRVRLGVLGILNEADRATFAHLRDALEVTDGNLSAHLTVLADAGLVRVDKGFEGRRPRTWVWATRSGRRAFSEEIETLRRLVARVRD
ncbi:MAG TPA: transcriptional regulator [Candidatus Dormibacteraeota bacterium]|nr:transcriptional regulator [Candidatus Dormibacteraeota bacterium]